MARVPAQRHPGPARRGRDHRRGADPRQHHVRALGSRHSRKPVRGLSDHLDGAHHHGRHGDLLPAPAPDLRGRALRDRLPRARVRRRHPERGRAQGGPLRARGAVRPGGQHGAGDHDRVVGADSRGGRPAGTVPAGARGARDHDAAQPHPLPARRACPDPQRAGPQLPAGGPAHPRHPAVRRHAGLDDLRRDHGSLAARGVHHGFPPQGDAGSGPARRHDRQVHGGRRPDPLRRSEREPRRCAARHRVRKNAPRPHRALERQARLRPAGAHRHRNPHGRGLLRRGRRREAAGIHRARRDREHRRAHRAGHQGRRRAPARLPRDRRGSRRRGGVDRGRGCRAAGGDPGRLRDAAHLSRRPHAQPEAGLVRLPSGSRRSA